MYCMLVALAQNKVLLQHRRFKSGASMLPACGRSRMYTRLLAPGDRLESTASNTSAKVLKSLWGNILSSLIFVVAAAAAIGPAGVCVRASSPSFRRGIPASLTLSSTAAPAVQKTNKQERTPCKLSSCLLGCARVRQEVASFLRGTTTKRQLMSESSEDSTASLVGTGSPVVLPLSSSSTTSTATSSPSGFTSSPAAPLTPRIETLSPSTNAGQRLQLALTNAGYFRASDIRTATTCSVPGGGGGGRQRCHNNMDAIPEVVASSCDMPPAPAGEDRDHDEAGHYLVPSMSKIQPGGPATSQHWREQGAGTSCCVPPGAPHPLHVALHALARGCADTMRSILWNNYRNKNSKDVASRGETKHTDESRTGCKIPQISCGGSGSLLAFPFDLSLRRGRQRGPPAPSCVNEFIAASQGIEAKPAPTRRTRSSFGHSSRDCLCPGPPEWECMAVRKWIRDVRRGSRRRRSDIEPDPSPPLKQPQYFSSPSSSTWSSPTDEVGSLDRKNHQAVKNVPHDSFFRGAADPRTRDGTSTRASNRPGPEYVNRSSWGPVFLHQMQNKNCNDAQERSSTSGNKASSTIYLVEREMKMNRPEHQPSRAGTPGQGHGNISPNFAASSSSASLPELVQNGQRRQTDTSYYTTTAAAHSTSVTTSAVRHEDLAKTPVFVLGACGSDDLPSLAEGEDDVTATPSPADWMRHACAPVSVDPRGGTATGERQQQTTPADVAHARGRRKRRSSVQELAQMFDRMAIEKSEARAVEGRGRRAAEPATPRPRHVRPTLPTPDE
ncbi:unnamed protein product [Amoebophrya sp. A120]|nr:unnamed protein product [Amoebophrya sp. A120]|eukprot:GSA120T00015070001.1